MPYIMKLKKWSLARCQNVRYVYGLFKQDPERIELLDDNKEFQLVIMTKSKCDKLMLRDADYRAIQLAFGILKQVDPDKEIFAEAVQIIKDFNDKLFKRVGITGKKVESEG